MHFFVFAVFGMRQLCWRILSAVYRDVPACYWAHEIHASTQMRMLRLMSDSALKDMTRNEGHTGSRTWRMPLIEDKTRKENLLRCNKDQ